MIQLKLEIRVLSRVSHQKEFKNYTSSHFHFRNGASRLLELALPRCFINVMVSFKNSKHFEDERPEEIALKISNGICYKNIYE